MFDLFSVTKPINSLADSDPNSSIFALHFTVAFTFLCCLSEVFIVGGEPMFRRLIATDFQLNSLPIGKLLTLSHAVAST